MQSEIERNLIWRRNRSVIIHDAPQIFREDLRIRVRLA
jgi:hypothetical protein